MSEKVQAESGNILCDMCTRQDRKPARKTCMKCEISMCVQHLQAHLTTPVLLQTHPLTEPMAIGGSTKCPQHGKLLEYYCLDDMTCVCVSCAIEDQHRIHNMKTFSTAHKELMEKLKAEQQALQEKTENKNVSLEKWEQSEKQKLARCSVRLLEAVTNLRDVSLTTVQSSVSARMVAIRTSKSSMEAAQKEKDAFRFLQMYSQVNQDLKKAKAVDLRKGLEPGSHRDELVQEIREKGEKITKHTSDFIESLLILVDPEHHQEFTATSSDLIFEPQIVHPGISLSKDSRKVYYNSDMGQLSPSMLCIESTVSDPYPNISRWVISLSTDCDWTVGLCDKRYATDMKTGTVFGLRCQEQQLISVTTEGNRSQQVISSLDETVAQKMSRPETVEVMWSSPDTLSFFSRIGQYQRREILAMKMRSKILDQVFFVCLEKNELKKNVEYNIGFHQPNSSMFGASDRYLYRATNSQAQKQRKCSCGRVYTETTVRSKFKGQVYSNTSQSFCSCGNVIGSQSVTEVLCELL